MKNIIIILVGLGLLIAAFYAFNAFIYGEKQDSSSIIGGITDYRNAEFLIGGELMEIGNTLSYFGNDLIVDINNDGREDVVFLVTHSAGGSGTFYYAVAALNTEAGYVGSDGYLLGDRIAPQTTEVSQNPQHRGVIVVNYADRAAGEPMTTQPSVGKSVYIKLDVESMRWGIVETDFTGEANPEQMSLGMKTWEWQHALYNDGREIVPKSPDTFSITFTDEGSFSATTDCNSVGGTYVATDSSLTFSDVFSTKMFCENSQEEEFIALLTNTQMYHFTSRGELIFDLKFDSGTVTFR